MFWTYDYRHFPHLCVGMPDSSTFIAIGNLPINFPYLSDNNFINAGAVK